MDGYEQMAAVMKALAHPVRLQILQALGQEEACVCHLEALLGQRQAYISQHLMKLREAGLVIDRREGMNVFYGLADETIEHLLDTARQTLTTLHGEDMELAPPRGTRPADCPCPHCEAAAATVSLRSEGQ